jgi:hypothetical protein
MSPRRLQVMSLMARHGRSQLGRIAAELGAARNREMQQFDLADRIDRMMAQTAQPAGEALSRGQLSAAHFMGSTLARQLQDTRAQMSEAQAQRAALEQDLTRQAHRQQVLTERADETRRALMRAREDES